MRLQVPPLLDKISDRFWLIHTCEKVQFSDAFLRSLVDYKVSNLDRIWIPGHQMNEIRDLGDFKQFSLSHQTKFDTKTIKSFHSDEDISLSLTSNISLKILNVLKEQPEIKNSISFSSVGIRYPQYSSSDEKSSYDSDGEPFVIDDISYSGKFTVKGNSFDKHLELLHQTLSNYEKLLGGIEQNRISYVHKEPGYNIEGSPFKLKLTKRIKNIESFLNSLLSSTNPFRLWGVRKKIDENYYVIDCVDLHTGSKLDLECSPDWIRIYLPEGACGNVVLRLLTNIQHHYDSEASLEVT